MRTLVAISLVSILFAQSTLVGWTACWHRLANDSFTTLFCENQPVEVVPMCFGSCQIEEVVAGARAATEDGNMLTRLWIQAESLYVGESSPAWPLAGRVRAVDPQIKPANSGPPAGRAHWGRLWRPPTVG